MLTAVIVLLYLYHLTTFFFFSLMEGLPLPSGGACYTCAITDGLGRWMTRLGSILPRGLALDFRCGITLPDSVDAAGVCGFREGFHAFPYLNEETPQASAAELIKAACGGIGTDVP